jgi:hypothetical protein
MKCFYAHTLYAVHSAVLVQMGNVVEPNCSLMEQRFLRFQGDSYDF